MIPTRLSRLLRVRFGPGLTMPEIAARVRADMPHADACACVQAAVESGHLVAVRKSSGGASWTEFRKAERPPRAERRT